LIVKGQHNEAIVYAKALEANCEDKIRQYLDHPAFSDTKVRIMPDVHLGKSAVIGFTATYSSLIIPSIVGVDIGCGVCACNLGKGNLRFDKLDAFIRKNVPAGMGVRDSLHPRLDETVEFLVKRREGSIAQSIAVQNAAQFKNAIRKLSQKQRQSPERLFASLGTLGGGNHFIEVDVDEQHNRWLLIHSGSRILGARTAEYHEIAALRETDAESPLKYLSGSFADEYKDDVFIAQQYAAVNRALIAATIADGFFKQDIWEIEYRDSAHNYLDPLDQLIRKGAISARKDEPLVIPFSMSEGAILGHGKGNPDWNNSAPHGSGRKISRTQARNGLSLDEYRRQMRNVWSSVICKETLDESPMSYKKPKDVLDYIDGTVEIESRLMPVYNFKAAE
jgi:RNA-splicing ligase RtcB